MNLRLVLLSWALFTGGCKKHEVSGPATIPTPPPAPTTIKSEAWMALPAPQWPQLVLTNHASYRGHTPLRGASSFLLRSPDGPPLLVTARHLLGEDGGVNPPVPVDQFDGVLTAWKAHPRTLSEKFVLVERAERACFDVVFFALRKRPGELPATPLSMRLGPVVVGEEVFLLGCPYSEEGCRQNVYRGKVAAAPDAPAFTFSVDPPVNLRGFSGAPVIDRNGQAIGVFCRLGGANAEGKNTTSEAELLQAAWEGGDPDAPVRLTHEAADAARQLIQQQRLPATTAVRAEVQGGKRRLDLDPDSGPNDWRGLSHGMTIVVDRKSLAQLRGSVITYSPQQRGFSFILADPYRHR